MKTNPTVKRTIRKKPRTAAQRAATARMLAANKARRARTPKQKAARKRKNTVQGYYPNPRKTITSPRYRAARNAALALPFKVKQELPVVGWRTIGAFPTKEKAMEYAKAYQRAHPSAYIKIEW